MKTKYLMLSMLIIVLLLLSACGKKDHANQEEYDINLDFLTEDDFSPAYIDNDIDFVNLDIFESEIKEEQYFQNQDKLISIILNDETAVRDALFEIADIADLEVEIDPTINNSIMIKFIDRPLKYVLEKISEAAGIRFSVDYEGVIKFTPDNPYLKNYHIDFLNLQRSTKSSISIASAANEAGGSNSSASIESSYEGKMWNEIKTNIEYIIQKSKATQEILTKKRESLQKEKNIKNKNQNTNDNTSDNSKNKTSDKDENPITINYQSGLISIITTHKIHQDIEKYINSLRQTYSLQVMIEAKIVEVYLKESYKLGLDWSIYENPSWLQSAYFQEKAAASSAAAGGAAAAGAATSSTTAAPTITDQNSNQYIDEARNMLFNNMPINIGSEQKFNDTAAGISDTGNNILFKIFPTFGRLKIDAAINMLNRFGKTKTISSPRVIAMNNQQAVISFVKNQTYFTTKIEENSSGSSSGATNDNSTKYSISSEQKTVPEGVILNILPSINPYKNEIMLNIRPTISKITSYIQDPAESYLIAVNKLNIAASQIPIVELKEMDSILRIRNGEIIVIGGMHESRQEEQKSRFPGAHSIPFFGGLFQNKSYYNQEIETVIFVRATILKPGKNKVNNRDYDHYQNPESIIRGNWDK